MRWSGESFAIESTLDAREIDRHAVRMVVVDRRFDRVELRPFRELPHVLRAGDLVVVNDAATLPGSLFGEARRGRFEFRITAPIEDGRIEGIAFGDGDWRTRTEHRAPPPVIEVGEQVTIGSIAARVASIDGRKLTLEAEAGDALWQALYAGGLPVQYAHRTEQLPLHAVQTAYAARPWAAEMPSAGRPLTWDVIVGLRRAGIATATLTHAAGLGSIGDAAADAALPWPERYEIPVRTAAAIERTRAQGGRVIAIGTSVVRALEASGGSAGRGIATLRIEPTTTPRIVDGLVSGLHAPGESHFELLQAFAPVERLRRALAVAARHGLSAHELGDACALI